MIITTILALIFANAISNGNEKSIFYSRISVLALICSLIVTYNNLYVNTLHNGIGLYNGLLNVSSVTQSFTLFILIITSIVLINNCFFHSNLKFSPIKTKNIQVNRTYDFSTIDTKASAYNIVEYGLIINFVLCGAVFLMTSGDLITLFIAIELQSYALYILSTINKESEQATWGGLTYFLLGGLSSCFILLASSLIYINTGTTSLDGFYIITSITDISMNLDVFSSLNLETSEVSTKFLTNLTSLRGLENYTINISLILLVVGFLFKISAAPFHFWSPDVYDAIPTIVTTYVALIAKLSIFVILLELVYYIDGNMVSNQSLNTSFSWKDTILLSSLLSLIIGSVLGLTQYRIKRLYAYSTISHVGFILLALCVNKIESIQAYIFYILSYTVSNLNAFLILIAIGYTMYFYPHKQAELESNSANNLKDVKYSPIQLVSQLQGYFYINSYLALSLTVTLFSFIGIPPLIGFFAKQMVLSAALDNGYVFITLVGILTSVVSAAYYLNIIKTIFFSKPASTKSDSFAGNTETQENNFALNGSIKAEVSYIGLSGPLSMMISLLTLFLSLFIFVPNESFKLARALSALIFI